jgi:hypothetical protein
MRARMTCTAALIGDNVREGKALSGSEGGQRCRHGEG